MKSIRIRRIIVTAAVILAAYLLQTAIFPAFEIAGIKPNLMLIVTAAFGFMRGPREGMLIGFASGLAVDIQSGDMIGFYALIYLTAGYVNGIFEQIYFDEDIKLPLLLIGGTDLLYGCAVAAVCEQTAGRGREKECRQICLTRSETGLEKQLNIS